FTLGENTSLPLRIDLVSGDKVDIACQTKPDPEGRYLVGDIIGYNITTDQGVQIPFTPREIMHVKMANPINPYRGYSPTEAALTSIRTDVETSEYQLSFIENDAMPSSL